MEASMADSKEVKFSIIEEFGILSESAKGWKKAVRLVSWNDREGKYDLREWSPDDEKAGKGITLSREEMVKMKELLNSMDL